MHSTEKARNTTLDDEKYDVYCTALCNQPEAFTLDLGDDQSRYLS